MINGEINFRQLAYNYVLFSNIPVEKYGVFAQSFPSEPGDNAVLAYGYIDNQAGLSFELLCCAKKHEDGSIEYREPQEDTSFKLRYDSLDSEVETIPYRIAFDKYQQKVDMVMSSYGAGTDLEKIRKDTTFDQYRYSSHPDDILVLFFKPDIRSEEMWVRTSEIVDGKIAGHLMNKPNSPEFGVECGDLIKIVPVRLSDGEVRAVAELDF